jgi:hypothetical protein
MKGEISSSSVKLEIEIGNVNGIVGENFTLDDIVKNVLEKYIFPSNIERFGGHYEDVVVTSEGIKTRGEKLWLLTNGDEAVARYLLHIKEKETSLCIEAKISYIAEPKIKSTDP